MSIYIMPLVIWYGLRFYGICQLPTEPRQILVLSGLKYDHSQCSLSIEVLLLR